MLMKKKFRSCEIKGYRILINKITLINATIYAFFLKGTSMFLLNIYFDDFNVRIGLIILSQFTIEKEKV